MKLMWFHLMPYTELPDDFNKKHPSVWVDIHSSLFDPRRAHHMYNDFMDELEYAAECGFDAVCVNEHHSNGYGLMPSPNLIASSLARRTTDTALCVLGNSLALYNPPTRVAEEFAMIDVISGGRLIAGFPVGSPMDTCYAYGYLSYFGYKAGQATMDGFWAEMERLGKEKNPYHAGFLQFVGVAESRE